MKKRIGYCLNCKEWVDVVDDKCLLCGSAVPEGFPKKEYHRIRKEEGPYGVIAFWYSYHATCTPKDLAEPVEVI